MDPRQRSAERRRWGRIGFAFLIGVACIALTAALMALGVDDDRGPRGFRERPTWYGYLFGAAWIAGALFEAARRLLRGPTRPGKRARY